MAFSPKMIRDGFKIVSKTISKNSPTILTAIGVGLMGGGTLKAIIEAPKAKDELDELENRGDISHKEYIKEKVKIIGYHYGPVAIMEVTGALSIFKGLNIVKSNLALALTALGMKSDEIKDLESKIIELDGEKHLEKIKDDIAKDKVLASPFNNDAIINTGHGNMLMYDIIGKRFFLSDIEYIRQRRDVFNDDMAEQKMQGKIAARSLNQWYEEIGLPPLDGKDNNDYRMAPPIGEELGWENRIVILKFTSMLLPENQTCTVLGYERSGEPTWDFSPEDDGSDWQYR